jgi:hypothetical protein
MEKEFIPYEQALALKKLGFDEPCFGAFIGKEFKFFDFSNDLNGYVNDKNLIIGAPLYQQAFRWFRERHKLYHTINMFGDRDKPQYSYLVSGRTMNNPAHMWWYEDKDSHEEAELACLIKLIEIVKNNETHRIKTEN